MLLSAVARRSRRCLGAVGRVSNGAPPAAAYFSNASRDIQSTTIAARIGETWRFFALRQVEAEENASNTSAYLLLGLLLSCGAIVAGLARDADAAGTNADVAEDGLRYLRRAYIEKHVSPADGGVWVTYDGTVYDITRFVHNHPGGSDKIMTAAGKDLAPFWNLYRQHFNSSAPMDLLEQMKIGYVHPDDLAAEEAARAAAEKGGEEEDEEASNPYRHDPEVPSMMIAHQVTPINAEPPGSLLTDSYITPSELWFVRNHHPVPHIDASRYTLTIFDATLTATTHTTDDSKSVKRLTLHDLKTKFPQHTVVTSLQCGGNRRAEMNDPEVLRRPTSSSILPLSTSSSSATSSQTSSLSHLVGDGAVALADGKLRKKTNGSPWRIGAIATAEWTGVRLRDVLASLGYTEETVIFNPDKEASKAKIMHVHFEGADGMQASVPVRKAISQYGDLLLAHKMNGADIPIEHGYPLRAVVPGHVGVRNVKWVTKITLSQEEAFGPWQRGMSYKGFSPSVESLEGIEIEKIPSLQEQPVQSAITQPAPNTLVALSKQQTKAVLPVRGYAYSGGGRGIVRVDVSIDGGKTWQAAKLSEGSKQPLDKAWAWTFWESTFPVIPGQKVEVVSRATDASYNVQPDSVRGVWNLRGINNNAWHRVQAQIEQIEQETQRE